MDEHGRVKRAIELSARQSEEETFQHYQALLCLGVASSLNGDLEMAEAYLADALSGAERDLGPDHFLTFLVRNNMALLRGSHGDWEGALAILEHAAARCAEVLGEDDVHQTLMLRFNLGTMLLESGQPGQAELVLCDVLERRRRILGETHGEVLDTRQAIVEVLWLDGRREEAVELMGAVVIERLRRSGIEHPRTFVCVNDYSGMLRALGREDDAQEWARQLEGVEAPVGVR